MYKLSLALTALLGCSYVTAHGYTVWPVSRGFIKYGDVIDPDEGNWVAERGWPIPSGAGAMRTEEPETLPPVPIAQQTVLKAGVVELFWQWNDGADHVGPCTAFLMSTEDKTMKTDIGSEMDCAQNIYNGTIGKQKLIATPSLQKVTIPSGLEGKKGLYIIAKLEAHHIGPPYELYSDVMDIQISATGNNAIPPSAVKMVMYGWDKPAAAEFSPKLKMDLIASATAGAASGPVATGKPTVTMTGTVLVDGDSTTTLMPGRKTVVLTATVLVNAHATTTLPIVLPSDQAGESAEPAATSVASVATAMTSVVSAAASGATPAASMATPAVSVAAPAGSVAGAAGSGCDAAWSTCNVAWISAGASGAYTCQTDYVACQSGGKRKRKLNVNSR